MSTGAPALDDPRRVAMFAASAHALAGVRVVLAGCRARGWRFAQAWPLAVAMVDDPALADTLTATRGAWLRAYRGQPAARGERAAGVLAVDMSDDGGRPAGRSFGAFV